MNGRPTTSLPSTVREVGLMDVPTSMSTCDQTTRRLQVRDSRRLLMEHGNPIKLLRLLFGASMVEKSTSLHIVSTHYITNLSAF